MQQFFALQRPGILILHQGEHPFGEPVLQDSVVVRATLTALAMPRFKLEQRPYGSGFLQRAVSRWSVA